MIQIFERGTVKMKMEIVMETECRLSLLEWRSDTLALRSVVKRNTYEFLLWHRPANRGIVRKPSSALSDEIQLRCFQSGTTGASVLPNQPSFLGRGEDCNSWAA